MRVERNGGKQPPPQFSTPHVFALRSSSYGAARAPQGIQDAEKSGPSFKLRRGAGEDFDQAVYLPFMDHMQLRVLTDVNSHTILVAWRMSRPRHSKKEVEDAVRYAESKGWTWRKMGHWGRLFCAKADRDGCQVGVNGTPKDAGDHASQIRRAVDRCPHQDDDEGNNGNK